MADAVIGSAYLRVIPKMSLNPLKAEGLTAGSNAGESFNKGFGSKLAKIGKTASGALGGVVKAAAVASAAAGAAVGVIGKKVYDGYSQYEQLSGGMEKLFGESASTVMANADKAFMTAGKSANEYMAGVTSFASSLVKSVGGDTEEAARLADVAMQAMSDNVNTFGTDAESVQNAIQGLAKGNYSMLDNLSLGFNGSQQGMMDLINASGVLDHKLTKTSELADVGFGTMIEAIQKVQEDMGIAGTTAKEAMGTLEGSTTAAKAALENMWTAIGTGDPEKLKSAASGLVDSIFGVVDEETGKREGGVLANFSQLFSNVFQALGGVLPGIVSGALDALPDSISGPIRNITDTIGKYFGDIDIKGALGTAFQTVAPIVENAASGILGAIDSLVQFIDTHVMPLAQDAYNAIAPHIEAVWSQIQEKLPAMQQVFDDAMNAIKDLVDSVWPDISNIVVTASDLIGSAIEGALPIVEGAMNGIMAVVRAVWPIVTGIIRRAVGVIKNVIGSIGPIVGSVRSTFNKVKDAIMSPINKARDAVKGAVDKIKAAISGAKLSFPHINLPHFSVSGGKAPWGIGGKGSLPSFSVSWYAKGGYFDEPTLFAGVGERGGEFVWPSYAPYLDRYADALASRMGGTGGVNVYLTYNGTGDADELVSTLTRELRVLKATGAI